LQHAHLLAALFNLQKDSLISMSNYDLVTLPYAELELLSKCKVKYLGNPYTLLSLSLQKHFTTMKGTMLKYGNYSLLAIFEALAIFRVLNLECCRRV
jgi:hypothetical protein